jgi:hypothetical protein
MLCLITGALFIGRQITVVARDVKKIVIQSDKGWFLSGETERCSGSENGKERDRLKTD